MTIRVFTLIVELQHIKALFDRPAQQRLHHSLLQVVVTVHKLEVTAPRGIYRRVACGTDARILLAYESHLGMVGSKGLHECPAPIG